MQPRQTAYLLDILRSIEVIQDHLAGYSRERFIEDVKTQDAVLRRLLVIGEAAARSTPESCAELPAIPFPRIVGMRNRVVHDYGHVDLGNYLGNRANSSTAFINRTSASLRGRRGVEAPRWRSLVKP